MDASTLLLKGQHIGTWMLSRAKLELFLLHKSIKHFCNVYHKIVTKI